MDHVTFPANPAMDNLKARVGRSNPPSWSELEAKEREAAKYAASQQQAQGGIGYSTCTADRDAVPHARLVDQLRSEVCALDEKIERHRDLKELMYLVEQNPAMARMHVANRPKY